MFNQPVTKTFDVFYPQTNTEAVSIGETVARELYARMTVTERRIIAGQSVVIGLDSCGANVRMRLPYGVCPSDLG